MTKIDDLLADANRRMDKSVEATTHELTTVRTGRASCGAPRPHTSGLLRAADAAAAARDHQRPRAAHAHGAAVRPERDQARSSARSRSPTSASRPANDGKTIRLPIPQLTEERRKELVKVVRNLGEEGRIAVRNVRRDVMHHLKDLAKDGDVGDDEERRAEEQAQKLTDDHVQRIDDLLKRKEEEIMEV